MWYLDARVRLGSAIMLLPLRTPAAVAKAVATLDIISGGRVTMGIGVGGEYPKEFEACGVPVNERGGRTDESIHILRALWTQDTASYHGRYFHFSDVAMRPKPIQLWPKSRVLLQPGNGKSQPWQSPSL